MGEKIINFHQAGIVPVAGQPLDFNFPWHDSLQPIAQNYLAVERAVVECAYAGCDTIWIVCHNDMQPLIRHRLGEYVQDPVYLYRKYNVEPLNESRKPIPLYYVPIHPKDRFKRDCLAWSVLYGAKASYYTSKQVSKWTVPNKYYVAFPYGVYEPEILREHRKEIASDKGFLLSYCGKTVRDNEYLGFTFDSEDFVRFRKEMREKGTGAKVPNQQVKTGEIPSKILPLEERWSARFFSLDKIFGSVTINKVETVELPWYWNIDNWEGLKEFLSSGDEIRRPNKDLLSYHEFNSIGE
tara:strand:- start:294 stop:1181 length:888 start_codon:yes stop_codon:yes gene_type:complete